MTAAISSCSTSRAGAPRGAGAVLALGVVLGASLGLGRIAPAAAAPAEATPPTVAAIPPTPVVHVPPAEGSAGKALELFVEAPSATPTMTLHYRRAATIAPSPFASVELVRRDAARWVAVLPGAAVTAPAIEYYLEAGGAPAFASPAQPHTLPVKVSAVQERRARDLQRAGGARSRVHLGFDWIDYGTRRVEQTRLVDRYYRVDADFSYRLLAYPLEEIRVGYTRLIGDSQSQSCPSATPCTAEAGYKVGGWFELGLAAVEGVRLDARLLVMASQSGFEVGGRAELRLGVLESNHLALAVESMADVGTSGSFRLGWGSVPGLPMAATVEVTDLPDGARPTGVRLYYDVSRALGNGLRLGVRLGYAARTQQITGFTGGGNATLDF